MSADKDFKREEETRLKTDGLDQPNGRRFFDLRDHQERMTLRCTSINQSDEGRSKSPPNNNLSTTTSTSTPLMLPQHPSDIEVRILTVLTLVFDVHKHKTLRISDLKENFFHTCHELAHQ